MEAVRHVRAARYGSASIDTRDVYDIVLMATGDEKAAEAAYRARLSAELDAGREPKV